MKIAVEGQIIDTDNIYSISDKVLENNNNYYFNIVSFNDNELEVSIKQLEKNESSEKFETLRVSYLQIKETDMSETEKKRIWEEVSEVYKQIPIENKNKLEKMRQDIVNLWSDNQAKIPTFDIKKY